MSEPHEHKKDVKERKFLSEAVLVAAASALSYAVAYAYRAGFGSYFDLPPLLLTPTLAGILRAGAAVAGFLLFLFVIINGLWMFLPHKDSAVRRNIQRMFFILVVIVLGLYWLFAYKWGWAVILGIVCFLGFHLFIFPLITQRKLHGYENKLLAQEKVMFASNMLTDEVGASIGRGVLLLAIASYVLIVFANSLGHQTAKNQEDYFVLTGTPDHVVAAMDDDMIILVAYDPAAMTLKRQYTIQRLTSERVWLLEKKHIGKLLEPPPLKASSPQIQRSVSPTGSASQVQPAASPTASSSPTEP